MIDVANGGLSAARNVGLREATGEIVAYTDADVRVDPDWLSYLVQPFLRSEVVAAGGPNVVPPDDPWIAQCVARAPGGPTQVLFDDRIAEHVPGCNFSVRRDALLAIGGFNPIYLRAGDDVDVCWRLQARGGTIGFAPSALVWHHHRATIGAYWRQQIGYGEGEAWLQPHHPDKFVGSRIQWRGHVYSPLPFVRSLFGIRVNSGAWGTAAFPSIYRTDVIPALLAPQTLTWQVSALLLTVFGALLWNFGLGWPAVTMMACGILAIAATLGRCLQHAMASDIRALPPLPGRSLTTSRILTRGLIALLHFLQPLARIRGQLRGILAPPEVELGEDAGPRLPTWHDMRDVLARFARQREPLAFWSESWLGREALLTRIVQRVRSTRIATSLEVDDGWRGNRDVSLQLGRWGRLDVQMLVEEHAQGKVLVRIARCVRVLPFFAVSKGAFIACAAAALSWSGGWLMAALLPFIAALMIRAFWYAGGCIALADQIMTRELVDAGAMPLGHAAAEVAARIAAADERLCRPALPFPDRSGVLNAAPRSTGTVRHAS